MLLLGISENHGEMNNKPWVNYHLFFKDDNANQNKMLYGTCIVEPTKKEMKVYKVSQRNMDSILSSKKCSIKDLINQDLQMLFDENANIVDLVKVK